MSKIVYVVAWEPSDNDGGLAGFDWYLSEKQGISGHVSVFTNMNEQYNVYQFRARVSSPELATSEIDDYIWNGKSDALKVLTFESDPLDCRPLEIAS